MKKPILFLFLMVSSIVSIAQSNLHGRVSISEVYYDTYIDEREVSGFGEFIELFNSSTESIDISGWKIYDNFSVFTLPQGTIITSGGYKVIVYRSGSTLNASNFVTLFPEAVGHEVDILFQSNIKLGNKFDNVTLRNSANQVQQVVQYGNWYRCSSCKFITTGINNSNTGSVANPIPDVYKQGFYQSNLNEYYGYDGSTTNNGTFQKTTVHPFALQLNVPLLPLVPDVPIVTNENGNWVHSDAFNFSGTKIAASRSYFNFLGKPTQSLSYDVKENKMWASETLYDFHGRAALQTLSAPVSVGYNFGLHENFIKDASGGEYTIADFDSGYYIENPSQVSTNLSSSPLGWYYSANNTDNPYQDVTSYPFSRTIFSKLNPGSGLKTIGGNKVNKFGSDVWVNGYSFTMPAAQEMYYAFGKDYFPEGETILNPSNEISNELPGYYRCSISACDNGQSYSNVYIYFDDSELIEGAIYKMYYLNQLRYFTLQYAIPLFDSVTPSATIQSTAYDSCPIGPIYDLKVTKTVNRDVNGVETIIFTDSEGNTLAAARSGNEDNPTQKKYNVVSPIGEQGFVDIHIPVGCGGTVTFKGPTNAFYKIYDLVSDSTTPIMAVYSSPINLNPGIYRIQEITLNHNNPLPYVKINGTSIDLIDSANQVAVSYYVNYYDYSLNYFDKAGRLTESVQPEGFDDALTLATSTRNHQLTSTFDYNTLGQLQNTTSPDEGTASFKYRTDGQIRFSQNSKQQTIREFSYTNYDSYGRPVESGVFTEGTITFANADNLLDNILQNVTIDNDGLPNSSCKEQVFTVYDLPDSSLGPLLIANSLSVSDYRQTYVAGNVSKTYTVNPVTTTTWYSYDVAGKLRFMIQDISGLGLKTIDYDYDFATNQVIAVDYQRGSTSERFIHNYEYNVVGQLVRVITSLDNLTFKEQAEYIYDDAGVLVRTELAEDLQGIDYVYNLNGQLKAINSPQSTGFIDPGNDSPSTNGFKPDVFGMIIDYHEKDFSRTGSTLYNGLKNGDQQNQQFNGNIANIRWNNDAPTASTNIDTYRYHYNKNNWLAGADYGTSTAGSTVSFAQNSSNDYQVSNINYDANGNIKTLKRNKNTESGSNAMDNFTYNYKTGKNQLDHVVDAVTTSNNAEDLKSQTTGNYSYNTIGQLIQSNENENVVNYAYNASGLVTEIKKNNVPLVKFFYSDRGQKVRKEIYNSSGSLTDTDHYVIDASGNVMAIYRGTLLKELPIYGSSRVGVYYKQDNSTVYQLTDHLGNVRAVIGEDTNNNLVVMSHTDYYPFGMPMPNRNVEGGYRYGYQGEFAEKEAELGNGINSFQLRLWDSRIGRWMSPDPYGEFHSPYLGMGNNPISNVDPDGGSIDCPDCPNNGGTDGVWNSSDGLSYEYNDGQWQPIIGGSLNEVVINGQASGGALASVARTTADFIPLVGSGLDIYEGIRDGDGWQVAMGVGFLALDIFTFGGGSVIKGGIKTSIKIGAREVAEEGIDQVVKKSIKIQRHHIIPKKVFKDTPELIKLMKRDVGQNLKKLPSGFHGNHPAYSNYVNGRINNLIRTGNLSAESIKSLQKEMSLMINKAYDNYKLTGENLNTFFKNQ